MGGLSQTRERYRVLGIDWESVERFRELAWLALGLTIKELKEIGIEHRRELGG